MNTPHRIARLARAGRLTAVLLAGAALVACGESNSESAPQTPAVAGDTTSRDTTGSCHGQPDPGADCVADTLPQPQASCRADQALDGGRNYPVYLTSASAETIAFQVFEPTGGIDCRRGHPLVLHGHGFGGSRSLSGFDDYLAAGFTVISIDQRGFGESGGTVRVMDPEFEGDDLVQILDWAEDNLDYLRKQQEPELPPELNPNLVVGAIGGSYGGGYQLLLHGLDPKQRMDALVPDITWHDLRYSLNPGDVIKSGWDLVLVAGGEAGSGSNQNGGLDPIIREILVQGMSLNRFPAEGLDFIYYHSPAYRCAGVPIAPADAPSLVSYQIDPPAYDVAPTAFRPVDVLLTQGMKDTLFNFNEAWRNFECLSALGGDVRLLTHQSGHILPLAAPDELQPASYVDPAAQLLEIPSFQGAAGAFACGEVSIARATLDWLRHKLLVEPLPDYFDGSENQVCLSTGDGQSVQVPFAQFPAPSAVGSLLTGPFMVERSVATTTPVASGYEALASAATPPTALPLGTVGPGGAVIGGIPTARLTVADLAGRTACEAGLPDYSPGCDPIVFIGIGVRGEGESRWLLVDDQIQPVRGLKQDANIELVGIAEHLAAGDELALLVYGYHPQYLESGSRDALVPFVNLSGTVQLPVLEGSLEPPVAL
ncbi:alpha/beta hydrolase [Marinobacter sp. SS21]|uniref:alpha/beta hydrolase n=1 Tax=Marinobacter sp. SS21 TaxID=2979460 RepID=UPI002330A8EE|nr:alpha/beta fold hydrolase [Marinobacter sp. SS21]MDC0664146.1 CocE/NonD family hydrolase [Marinobacter sp. SS21]